MIILRKNLSLNVACITGVYLAESKVPVDRYNLVIRLVFGGHVTSRCQALFSAPLNFQGKKPWEQDCWNRDDTLFLGVGLISVS